MESDSVRNELVVLGCKDLGLEQRENKVEQLANDESTRSDPHFELGALHDLHLQRLVVLVFVILQCCLYGNFPVSK